MTYRARRRGQALTGLVLVASAIVVVAGIWWIGHRNSEPVPITRSAPTSAPAPQPSRTPAPTSTGTSTAPAAVQAPTELVLSSVRVRLPVVPVGVSRDGQMTMPDDPADIGWYRFGPAPGAARGSAVLAGHVDSKKYGVGPLARLRGLSKGETVVVRSADRPRSFRVTEVRVISKAAVPLDQIFARTGSPQLRIVTCGGPYVKSQGGYQDNVVVTAVPIGR